MSLIWDMAVEGSCLGYGQVTPVIGIINIDSDFIMLDLPIPLIWSLNISTDYDTKVAVDCDVLGGGTYAVACTEIAF